MQRLIGLVVASVLLASACGRSHERSEVTAHDVRELLRSRPGFRAGAVSWPLRRPSAQDPTLIQASWGELRESLPRFTSEAPSAVLQALPSLLREDDPVTRALAAYAAESLGESARPLLSQLAHCLSDSDSRVAQQAAHALAAVAPGAESAVQIARSMTRGTSMRSRATFCHAIARMGREGRAAAGAVASFLREMMTTDGIEQVDHAVVAANALAAIAGDDEKYANLLVDALEAVKYRGLAVSIGRTEVRSTLPRLVELAEHSSDLEVRSGALIALRELGLNNQRQATVVAKLLNSDTADLRRYAALVLGDSPSVSQIALPQLVRSFRDRDVSTRIAAIEAVAALGTLTEEVQAGLSRASSDEHSAVREAAVTALRRLESAR